MSPNDSWRVSRPPMAPGGLPVIPWERSCGILGVIVGALLMFVGLSWGASGRGGGCSLVRLCYSVLTCGARVRS